MSQLASAASCRAGGQCQAQPGGSGPPLRDCPNCHGTSRGLLQRCPGVDEGAVERDDRQACAGRDSGHPARPMQHHACTRSRCACGRNHHVHRRTSVGFAARRRQHGGDVLPHQLILTRGQGFGRRLAQAVDGGRLLGMVRWHQSAHPRRCLPPDCCKRCRLPALSVIFCSTLMGPREGCCKGCHPLRLLALASVGGELIGLVFAGEVGVWVQNSDQQVAARRERCVAAVAGKDSIAEQHCGT